MSEQPLQTPETPEVLNPPPQATPPVSQPAQSSNGGTPGQETVRPTIDMLMDVSLQLSVVLGQTRLSVRQVLDLQKGSVIELDRMAGDAVDVYVNDRLIAQGEVVVVDDNFGVRISRLISPNHEEGAA